MSDHVHAPSDIRDALRLFWQEADRTVVIHMAVSLTLVLSAGVLAGLAPVALKMAVDSLESGRPSAVYLTPVALIGAYVACQFLARAASELRMFAQSGADRRIQRLISRRLFEHVMRLPMRYHLERRTGAVGQTLALGLSGYQQLLQQIVYTLIPVAAELTTISAVLAHLGHPSYLGILAVAAAAYLSVFALGAKRLAKPSLAVAASGTDAHALLADCLLNHETVKYFAAERAISERFHASLMRAESAWARYYRELAVNGLSVATIFALSLGASLAFAASEVARGSMTLGDFVLINAYVLQLVRPIETLGTSLRSLSHVVGFLHNLLELFRERPEPAATMHAHVPASTPGDLAFDSVSFSYRPERRILNRVSFTVPDGKTVAVVGLSGCGKSTLVRLLFRLYEPDSGTVRVAGRSISEMSLETLRGAIAVVPQDTVLFNDTIAYNIGVGRAGSTRAEIEHAAKLAHLGAFIASLPEGYETIVGERGLKLSGGEKQRVAIARAAIKRPRIFVFDEATSSLDTRTEREILANLLDLSRTTTTLIIAHRLSTVVRADEILVMHEGAIVERGRHLELMERNGRYAALWQAQQIATGSDSRVSVA
jgi:ATP-binding cassette subfamily B protein